MTHNASTDARQRIQAAFDPQLLRHAGHRLADVLAEHFTRIEASAERVLNWNEPEVNVAAARQFLEGSSSAAAMPHRSAESPTGMTRVSSSDALAERFVELVQAMLARGHNLHDPRYIGHQVPASVPLAGLFDAVGSVTNQVMAIYEMGPWASAVEHVMVETLGEQIGWKRGEFAGVVTHGGSLANTTALLTARNVALSGVWEDGVQNVAGTLRVPSAGLQTPSPSRASEDAYPTTAGSETPSPQGASEDTHPTSSANGLPPVIVAHAEAHYCIARSAGILGLGTNQVVRAALDQRRKIDPQRLDETLAELRAKNQPIVAVVAGACATPVGAFDPLNDIADVCRRHDVWLHVDAAHGGAACMSRRYRHLVAGLERADSLIWDAHKMLFVPALCAFVFYRDPAHRFEAFRQDAPYLFDPSAPGLADYDSGLKTVECTKRAAAFGLWGVWSLFGPQLFADMVDVTFDLGRLFYEKLAEAPDFEPLHEPECNIVVFRHVPRELRDAPPEALGKFQLDLRREVIESGAFYIVPTTSNGIGALRVTIINPLTTAAHLDLLLETLREKGASLARAACGRGR